MLILVMTNHPCLRVGCHSSQRRLSIVPDATSDLAVDAASAPSLTPSPTNDVTPSSTLHLTPLKHRLHPRMRYKDPALGLLLLRIFGGMLLLIAYMCIMCLDLQDCLLYVLPVAPST
jgi:hypothetical protein